MYEPERGVTEYWVRGDRGVELEPNVIPDDSVVGAFHEPPLASPPDLSTVRPMMGQPMPTIDAAPSAWQRWYRDASGIRRLGFENDGMGEPEGNVMAADPSVDKMIEDIVDDVVYVDDPSLEISDEDRLRMMRGAQVSKELRPPTSRLGKYPAVKLTDEGDEDDDPDPPPWVVDFRRREESEEEDDSDQDSEADHDQALAA